MSLKNDLLNIQNVKNDIKLAIENKLSNSIDMNFINYPGYINNIPTGSGDVKLFDSIINMQSSSGNQEGDLAVVYTSTQANITEDTEFQIATFPETVTLTSAISDYIEVGFVPVESTGGMFDCFGNLDSSRFSLDIYGDSGSIRIQYTSQDGLTYTRTTFKKDNVTIEGDEIDFGIVIKFGSRWGEAQWDDRIGQFVITGSSDFEGLFQYEDNSFNYAKTQFTASAEDIYKKTSYGLNGIAIGTLQNINNLTINQLLRRSEIYSSFSELSLDQNITNLSDAFKQKQYKYIPNFDTSNVVNMHGMFTTCENLIEVPNFDTSNVTDMVSMFAECCNLTTVPNFDTSNVVNMQGMFAGCNNLITIPNLDTSNVTSMYCMFLECNNLTTVPNFDTSNVTSMYKMFSGCNNLTTVPNLDTSNVVNMVYMLSGCTNLITIPNFNMSNVNTVTDMFFYCTNLIAVPNLDISKLTDMSFMFNSCFNLVDVPCFNTSNVTSMSKTFKMCNNLSDSSIQNIINMCLNSNITSKNYMNLSGSNFYSPFNFTNIANTRYQNRWAELDAAGWNY